MLKRLVSSGGGPDSSIDPNTSHARPNRLPNASGGARSQEKWNNVPPPNKSAYANQKPAPAPRRDLSGIWDGITEGGDQAKGVFEYPATLKDHPADEIGGQPDESNITRQLPYTAAGLAALKTHKVTVGVRAVDPSFTNYPVHICDPEGFPGMELHELKIIQLIQTKNQVDCDKSIQRPCACHLDRRTRTPESEGRRAEVVRLLDRQMGGRLYVCG